MIADIDNNAPPQQKIKKYADVLFCIVDSAKREGISIKKIMKAGRQKLKINKARQWKDNGDGSYSYIK